ncbi:hypothetical protein C8J56DRAFT_1010451 [Mycena floridula]|nr:hypothetical protein C8J56DRAFT_1010451 [Mycena floridula]
MATTASSLDPLHFSGLVDRDTGKAAFLPAIRVNRANIPEDIVPWAEPPSPPPPSPPPKPTGSRSFGFGPFRQAASSSSLSLTRPPSEKSTLSVPDTLVPTLASYSRSGGGSTSSFGSFPRGNRSSESERTLNEDFEPPHELRKVSSMFSVLIRKKSKVRLRSGSDETEHPSLRPNAPPLPTSFLPMGPSPSSYNPSYGTIPQERRKKESSIKRKGTSHSTTSLTSHAESDFAPSPNGGIFLDTNFDDITSIVNPSLAGQSSSSADTASPLSHARTYSSDNSFSSYSGSYNNSMVPVFHDPFNPGPAIVPQPRTSSRRDLNGLGSHYSADRKVSPKSLPPLISTTSQSQCKGEDEKSGPPSTWVPPQSWEIEKDEEKPEDEYSSDDSMVGEGGAGGGGRPLAFNKSHHDVSSFDIDDLPLSTPYPRSLRSPSTTSGSTNSSSGRNGLPGILTRRKKKDYRSPIIEPPRPPNSSLDPADRKYTIRIYRANNTYHVVSVGFQVTVANLTPKLKNRLLMGKETETHRLYLKEKGRERILASTERPADIVRRRLEQAGYEIADGLELLGGDGLSFLLKFVYKSQLLGPAEEDIKVPSYTTIDLGGRSLRTIPVSLHRHAHQIISLSLSRNPMLEIPLDFIQSCTTLQELRLSHMAMKKVPHSVKNSPTLLRLDLSCNRIADLDEAFLDQIPGLQELYLQNNRMEKLPWYFPRMRSLTTLNISNNKFRAIPSVVCALESIRDLDVSFNLIQELPEEIGLLTKLERFIMVGNQVSSFPVEMRKLLSLRYLDCRRNQIGDFAEVCTLPTLETLCADHNALHALDLSLGSRLMCLDASHNEITKLTLAPGPMGKTYALTTLDISYAKLSSFDDLALASLTTLRTLKLDHNKFTSIPETLGDLAWLETLSCADNSLGALPNSIGCLQRLEILDAHSNNLTAIPDSLWNCKSLFKINLTSNLLRVWHPPPTTNSSPDIRIPPPQYPERKASAASLNSRLPPLAHVLEKLFLGENHFTDDMLHALTVLRELRVLNLSFNDLQDIPPSFLRSFSKLEELYLSGNKLANIPTEDLPKLTRLSVLYLNGNRLQTLPQELAKVQSLMVLDVGSNLLKYNINNWEFDWNWNFNKNLKYLNLSGNKRLQIKSDIPTRPKAATVASQASLSSGRSATEKSLAGFSHLTQLRVLGLMDVTITTTGANGALDIPDESDDRRVRTSHSTVCGMPYGIADTLGRNENLHMIDLVHEFPGRKDEAVFAMFGRALPPKNIPASSNRLAKYLHDRFIEVLLVQINALSPQNNEGLPDALRRTFLKLNQDLHDSLFSTRKMSQAALNSPHDILISKSGASGIVLYFVGKRLHVANAGNALAVISRGGSAVPVSQMHDPFDRLETARIRNAEGWISPTGLVNDEIDISRSFGFFHLLPMINARPFISTWELTEHDEFVIVGNRGLWDFVSYQTAVDIARRELDPMIAAQKLRDLVMSYGADGSTMVMVIGVKDLFKDNRSRKETLESLVDSQLFNNKQPLRLPGNKPTIIDRNISRLPLEVPPPTGHIAMVFTDIRNSTHLWQVNPGTHTAIRIHNSLLRRQLRFCGGYEVKTEGDSFMCSFPTTLSALWWCFTVQQQLLEAEWPLEILECSDGQPIFDNQNRLIARGLSVRMGIHCGTPLCEPDPITSRMDYFGPMVNRSARIMGSAAGGQIMCSVDVIREINAKILETEPETEYSDYQPPEAIDAIKRLGLVVIRVGEVRLKGLEAPEMLSLVYPSGLEGRQDLSELPTDPKTDPNSGSRVAFNVEQMRELGLLCLRLEALATGRLFRSPIDRKVSLALTADEDEDEATLRQDKNSLYLYGDLTLLLPSMSDTSSDEDLMLIMDSLSGRIENAIAAISGRASPAASHLKAQLSASLAARGGLDPQMLAVVLDVLNSL